MYEFQGKQNTINKKWKKNIISVSFKIGTLKIKVCIFFEQVKLRMPIKCSFFEQ